MPAIVQRGILGCGDRRVVQIVGEKFRQRNVFGGVAIHAAQISSAAPLSSTGDPDSTMPGGDPTIKVGIT